MTSKNRYSGISGFLAGVHSVGQPSPPKNDDAYNTLYFKLNINNIAGNEYFVKRFLFYIPLLSSLIFSLSRPNQSKLFVGSQQTGAYSSVSNVFISASLSSKSKTSKLGPTREWVAVFGRGTSSCIQCVRISKWDE